MSRTSALASDWYFLGRVRSLDEISAELDALTPRSVSTMPPIFAHLHNLTILTLGPTAVKISGWNRAVIVIQTETQTDRVLASRIWRSRLPSALACTNF